VKYTLAFVMGCFDVPFNAVAWQVYTMDPAFLTLLEAPLELTFRHCSGGQQLFVNFRGILETVLIAAVSFLETRRNHKGSNQASKEGGGLQTCF
jgi:hypothetical protein